MLIIGQQFFLFLHKPTLKKKIGQQLCTHTVLFGMFTFYLDAMVAQPRHEIFQCDVFMEESTHVSFSFDTRQSVLGSQILGKPSENETRFSHQFLLHYCTTVLEP